MLHRPWNLIDFLIANRQLVNLYPEDIDGLLVRQSIEHQINDRLNFLHNHPNAVSMYAIVILYYCLLNFALKLLENH